MPISDTAEQIKTRFAGTLGKIKERITPITHIAVLNHHDQGKVPVSSEPLSQVQYLKRVKEAVDRRETDNPLLLEYWSGLVRDSSGRWIKYSLTNPNYFIGYKPKPDLNNKGDMRLLILNLDSNEFLLQSLPKLRDGMGDDAFHQWLTDLHKKRAFIPETAGKISHEPLGSPGSHTPIVLDDVCAIAKQYGDPYEPKGLQRVSLPGIPQDKLPYDLIIDETVMHYYPNANYPDYIHAMNVTLTELLRMPKTASSTEKLTKLALFHQLGINVRMFERTNQALFSGISNTFLREMGLKPIECGILDFVGMRLQPEGFAKYFVDEVKRVNPQLT